ncbi:MAG: nuclear transport factor 2 family protein [Gammaproteobacteria bacterium]
MAVPTADIVDASHVYSIYARAIDEKRYDLLARVFTDDAALSYVVGPHEFSCRGDEAAGYFGAFLEKCWWTNHLIAAPMVEADGERLLATARVQATHLQRRVDGSLSRWLVRGSYHDVLERRGDAWLVVARYCHTPDTEGEFLADGVESFPDLAWTSPEKLGGAAGA